jgi:hypothetical protein
VPKGASASLGRSIGIGLKKVRAVCLMKMEISSKGSGKMGRSLRALNIK